MQTNALAEWFVGLPAEHEVPSTKPRWEQGVWIVLSRHGGDACVCTTLHAVNCADTHGQLGTHCSGEGNKDAANEVFAHEWALGCESYLLTLAV